MRDEVQKHLLNITSLIREGQVLDLPSSASYCAALGRITYFFDLQGPHL